MPPDSDAPRANPSTQEGAPLSNSQVPLRQRVRAYRLLWILALLTFVADQASKLWIVARVPYNPLHAHGLGHDTEIIRGFFYIIHVGNTGAAWSLFAGQTTMLALLALVTLGAIYFWRHALELRKRPVQFGFGLLCGGIIGNLVDRVIHGHVIDFLDFHFGDYIYPTFNVADAGICVGVAIYLIHSLRNPPQAGQPQ
jgi:signal peptidase II